MKKIFLMLIFIIPALLLADEDEFNTDRLPIGNPATKYDFAAVYKDSILDCGTQKNISFETLIQELKNYRIILIGESHTNDSHHQVQLQIMKGLIETGKSVCLALEMFNPVQNETLNQYTSGVITEEDFLNQADYFNTWGHNYRYYKPIFDFARMNKINMYGVNTEHSFASKIGRGGLASLSAEERAQLPTIDTTNAEHRFYIKSVMEGMDATSPKQFERIYQAQSLWDTVMGEGAISAAKENPDAVVIVLAGSGHVVYNLGIGRIIQDRSEFSFASLVSVDIPDTVKESVMMKVKKSLKKKKAQSDSTGTKRKHGGAKMQMAMMHGAMSDAVPYRIVARSLADFLWGLPEEKREKYPSLGFSVKDKSDSGFEIKMVYPESIAEQQGLKRGDIIQSVDGKTFANKAALKRYLGSKNWDEVISFEIIRGDKNIQFKFTIVDENEE